MCWISNKIPIEKIATENITVQKVLNKTNSNELSSPIYSCIWKKRVKCEEISEPEHLFKDVWTIRNGFHSCEKMCIVDGDWYCKKERIFIKNNFDILCEFIIPKGATYYKNENGSYVSNKLKFIKTLTYIR